MLRGPLSLVPGRARALGSVLAWLGPWTSEERRPRDVEREHRVLREGPWAGPRARFAAAASGGPPRLDAFLYRPVGRAPLATWVIAPGLHFLGPEDPRLDRFARVLASAGFEVVVPFLPAFLELLVQPSVLGDFELVVRRAAAWSGKPVSLFSISFGSWPALEVAARAPEVVDGVVTFGGYARFENVVRFCVEGTATGPGGERLELPRDPLNTAVLSLNLLALAPEADDREALGEAYRAVCRRTWGRPELKAPGRLAAVVEDLSAPLSPADRQRFRAGCGVAPGLAELLRRLEPRLSELGRTLSPGERLASLRCPVVVCHGRDDDVIPWPEAVRLHAALPPHLPRRLLLTGLYAHTGRGRGGFTWLGEARALLSIAWALASGGDLGSVVARAG